MKSFIAPLAAAAAVLLLSSCSSPESDGHADHQNGSESSAASTPTGQQPAAFNDADVTFVTDMIPHHEQAVQMSALVPDRSTDPAVLKLAADISAEQGPEIETMKAFLAQWKGGSESQQEDHSGMEGMQMPGMVDDGTMSKLQSLKGAEFDTLWLQSMIGHHEGAIGMSNTEIAGGANADAKKLAQEIVTTQQAEIGQMKKMLGG
ncbi:MAG TPA: DUF305 domain-containing protein [Mycobacterium sp.]